MENDLVKVASFIQPTEAHLLRMRLESEGIPCYIADENMVTTNWQYATAIGGVKLYVRASDIEKVKEILDIEPECPQDEADKCPVCGSEDIQYEKFSRKLFFLSWLLLGFPLPYPEYRWQCHNCGHQWKSQNDIPEKNDNPE